MRVPRTEPTHARPLNPKRVLPFALGPFTRILGAPDRRGVQWWSSDPGFWPFLPAPSPSQRSCRLIAVPDNTKASCWIRRAQSWSQAAASTVRRGNTSRLRLKSKSPNLFAWMSLLTLVPQLLPHPMSERDVQTRPRLSAMLKRPVQSRSRRRRTVLTNSSMPATLLKAQLTSTGSLI